MHGVLFQEKCLESVSEAVNAQITEIRIVKIIAEQVPYHRPSHSEGTTTVRVRLEP